MEIDLGKAIAAGELDVWYQPQLASDSLRIVGFEALARWNHPHKGQVGPESFPQHSDAVSDDLAAFVLARACADAARWPQVMVAVNVAPHRFGYAEFADDVEAIALQAGLPLQRLELEILEHAAFEDPDAARAVMRRLRGKGVKIAIDDFGQGFSREALLLDLPVSKIKLAHALVTDPASAEWIRDFVKTAHALRLEVTAEGVETQEQADAMQAAGCDYMQGFFFARALPAADVSRALSAL